MPSTPRRCATCSSSSTRCSDVVANSRPARARGHRRRHHQRGARRRRQVRRRGAFPLNMHRRRARLHARQETHEVTTPTGFKEAYAKYVEGGWPALSCDPEFGGQGLPLRAEPVPLRDAQLRQPGLDHVPGPVARRLRGAARARHGRAEEAVPAQAGQRRVDRHHVPDRAALRHRPRHAAHQGRAAGRRQLQAHRQQDLHLRRRARHGREHHPPGARAPARRTAGQQGHLAVRGAQVHA